VKRRPLLIADLFCGAGGLSEAASIALKKLERPYKLRCLNHWPVAIDTHKANHPEAEHFCQDIAAARPIIIVPEGYLDLLIAAPTCTFYSQARGGRPTSDQQRMDPWHIITWLTELRTKRLLLENVPEIMKWGPVDPRTGKPIKSREGEYFRAWIAAIKALGFKVEWRIPVCADYGDATTRKRFILQARSDGKPIEWPRPSHGKDARTLGDLFAPAIVKPWRTARECIDWSIPGRSIYGRKHPLSPKTILRIHSGATKFKWPDPFLVVLRQHMAARSIDLPMPTITAGGSHIGLAQPFMLGQLGERRVRGIDQPIQAVTSIPRVALVEPFICGAGGHEYAGKPVRTSEPFRTITPEDHRILVEPFILAQSEGNLGRAVSQPMPTIPGGGAHALIAPYYSNGSGQTCKPVEEPLDTITATDRFGLVVPITHAGGYGRVYSPDQPLPTLTTAKRGELAFVTASFGERQGQTPRVHDLEEPMPTVLAQGHVNLAMAAVNENADGAPVMWDIHYRMLVSGELANAHSFNHARKYVFKGNKTQRNKQIGNSVPVLMGEAHVSAAFHDLAVAA
jgi:DNA (cytosine-5)-methyltransferase 1